MFFQVFHDGRKLYTASLVSRKMIMSSLTRVVRNRLKVILHTNKSFVVVQELACCILHPVDHMFHLYAGS